MQPTESKSTPKPMTNEELTIQLSEAVHMVESLRQRVKNMEEDMVGMVNYVQELDAVTFVALYLWTGKFKKTDVGELNTSRVTQANALRINGRRALGEFREKQHVKDLKTAADELEIYYDANTPIEELEKSVSSERARLAALAEQKKREEADKKEKENAVSDINS